MSLPTDGRAPSDLIEGAATAVLNAWNASYALNSDVMRQAGESFKRRFYAETIIDWLRALPLEQRMEAMGLEVTGWITHLMSKELTGWQIATPEMAARAKELTRDDQ